MYFFKNYRIKDLLIFCAIAFIVPIIFFLVGTNLYATHLLREKVTASDRITMQLYTRQLTDKITSLESYLSNTGSNNILLKEFQSAKNYEERLLYGYLLIHQFRDQFSLYSSVIDGMFLYDSENEIFLEESAIVETVSIQDEIQNQIRLSILKFQETSAPISSHWISVKIEDSYYLFCIYHLGTLYYGSWSNAERILDELITVPIDGAESLVLVTSNFRPLSSDSLFSEQSIEWKNDFSDYYLTGNQQKYVVIGEKIPVLPFYLAVFISDAVIQKGTSMFRIFSLLFTILSFLLLLLFLRYTKREIAAPLKDISGAMKRVEKDDLTISLPENYYAAEFRTVNQNFNRMVKEICRLKIKVYEEQLQSQKAQLDFLRIQMNPHFFINAMNAVYHYAILQNMEMVQNMTMSLVKHFRYTLYGDTMVTVKEEIDFIQNYLHLQDLRAAGESNIILECNIPEELLQQKIPILLIQPFVENSIKYGESQIQKVLISIEASRPNLECFTVCIRDFGNGFPQDILELLQKGEPILRDGKKRIGINNVKTRLQILYKDRASIHFSNQEYGGAVVEISICFQDPQN